MYIYHTPIPYSDCEGPYLNLHEGRTAEAGDCQSRPPKSRDPASARRVSRRRSAKSEEAISHKAACNDRVDFGMLRAGDAS